MGLGGHSVGVAGGRRKGGRPHATAVSFRSPPPAADVLRKGRIGRAFFISQARTLEANASCRKRPVGGKHRGCSGSSRLSVIRKRRRETPLGFSSFIFRAILAVAGMARRALGMPRLVRPSASIQMAPLTEQATIAASVRRECFPSQPVKIVQPFAEACVIRYSTAARGGQPLLSIGAAATFSTGCREQWCKLPHEEQIGRCPWFRRTSSCLKIK